MAIQINVRLDEALAIQLRTVAQDEDRTVTSVVVRALRQYLGVVDTPVDVVQATTPVRQVDKPTAQPIVIDTPQQTAKLFDDGCKYCGKFPRHSKDCKLSGAVMPTHTL